jgi:nicotinamide-nucleotide amidase
MTADIITIGDEILIGQVIDTNSAWIAEQLSLLGIKVRQMLSIADERELIIKALTEAHVNADLIILTGGLGPTKDDKTKPAICDFFQTKLVLNQASLENTSRIFKERNLKMTEENKKQAMLPESCIPLANKIGTAWGMWLEKEGTVTVSLPGVPYEMKYLMEHEVLPMLQKQYVLPSIVHKTIITQGIGESWLAEKIADWEDFLPKHIFLAYLPAPGIVRLRLSATGPDKDALEEEMEQQVEKLKQLIPDFICGYGKQTLQEIIGKLLMEKNQTISTAESCTGGHIAQLLTSVSGSSAYFMGSIISYADYVKENELGVNAAVLKEKGAVSREVAEQMALGAIKKLKTDYAISATGIAGPTGGRLDKPVGTVWIAIGTPNGVVSQKFLFGDNRERNIVRTSLTALNMLRKILQT